MSGRWTRPTLFFGRCHCQRCHIMVIVIAVAIALLLSVTAHLPDEGCPMCDALRVGCDPIAMVTVPSQHRPELTIGGVFRFEPARTSSIP